MLLRIVFLLALCLPPGAAGAFEIAARAAILVDHRNDVELFSKEPDTPLPPASMSKLMTALLVFEDLKSGRLGLDQELPVSEKAWRMGGSRMFVEVNTRVTVRDLLRGVIVQSGNDACIVLAEALAGSEQAFVDRMNQRARELGLENSHFANVTGWPDPAHRMSVRDLAKVARLIIERYPEYYELYSIREFEYNGINQQNRNPLLQAEVPGVDGMKTGYTSEAGYGLVASAERDGRRLILGDRRGRETVLTAERERAPLGIRLSQLQGIQALREWWSRWWKCRCGTARCPVCRWSAAISSASRSSAPPDPDFRPASAMRDQWRRR